MKTKVVRLYGKNDLRLEEFELPAIGHDEILAKVMADSICMSTYKAVIQGKTHKRVPDDVEKNPIIVGHEFCGIIEEVGEKWRCKFRPGDKFIMQTALNENGSLDAPGFSFPYVGGDATYILIPNVVMEQNCLLHYDSDAFFHGCLAEPMGCIIGAFHASYHTAPGSYCCRMGIKENGKLAVLAGAGPMGLGAIDYALHCGNHPGLLVVTDIDGQRLKRARSIYTQDAAKKLGIQLEYINTNMENPRKTLLEISDGGFDDVFVMAPVAQVVELADSILARNGCLNFFAGPTDPNFSAKLNFFNVHYASTHIVGTSGGNTEDMAQAVEMMRKGFINPASMITHVGGLDAVIDTTLNLPNIPGGKKLIYNQIRLPLTDITSIDTFGKTDTLHKKLGEVLKKNNMIWNAQAERILLEYGERI